MPPKPFDRQKQMWSLFRLHPDASGQEFYRQLAGRLALVAGELWILEDPFELMAHAGVHRGPVDQAQLEALGKLRSNPYIEVVSQGDLESGEHPASISQAEFEDDGSGRVREAVASRRPPAVFEYQRLGMDTPATIEVAAGKYLLNAKEMSPEEVQLVLTNVRNGLAVLRYKQAMEDKLQKAETNLLLLLKAEDREAPKDVHGVLERLKGLAAAGHIDPKDLDVLHQELYGDKLVPGLGNKQAYSDFLTRPRPGAHIAMDLAGLKRVNDELGHKAGDQAISSAGRAMREAMDETVGAENGKLFRVGGDEFMAHVPSHEHAAQFARALRGKLEALAPIAGTHRIGTSLGIGHTPDVADVALTQHAKAAQRAAAPRLKPGEDQRLAQAPEVMYAHSLYQGREGAVPTGLTRKPILPPPPAVREPKLALNHHPTPPASPAVAPASGNPAPAQQPKH